MYKLMINRLAICFLVIFLIGISTSAYANPASDALVLQGRTLLFNSGNMVYSGIAESAPKFGAAVDADPADQTANFFYALTRVLASVLETGGTGNIDTVRDLYEAFGITIDVDLTVYEQPISIASTLNGEYDPPDTIPASQSVRTFLEGPLTTLLDGAIANLEAVDSTIMITLTADETGDDPIEVDYGDVMLFKSLLHTVKSGVLMASSYDFDMDIFETIVLSNADVLQIQRDLLDRYNDLMKLQSNGSALLTDAKQALFAGIDAYRTAFNTITNEPDYQGDDLFFFESEADTSEAAFLLSQFTELQNSLNENRSAASNTSEEIWLLTDSDGNRFRLDIAKDENGDFINGEANGIVVSGDIFLPWNSGCAFLFCSGWVDDFDVAGTDVTIQVGNSNCAATLTGTMVGGAEISGGTYTNCDGSPRGSFSGTLVSTDSNSLALDLNNLFGNPDLQNIKNPLDISAILPEFDSTNEMVAGTFPPVDDSSAVLNGIFPEYVTNQDLTDSLDLGAPSANTSFVSGSVSCSSYTSGKIFVAALERSMDGLSYSLWNGTYLNSLGAYSIPGLPVGRNIYLRAWFDADNNGLKSIGDFSTTSGPHEITQSGLTVDVAIEDEVLGGSISGQIDCNVFEPGHGKIYVNVVEGQLGTGDVLGSTTLEAPGSFAIDNVIVGSTGSVSAYWDANGTGPEGPDDGDFSGHYSGNPVDFSSQGANPGIDISLYGITGTVTRDSDGQALSDIMVYTSGIDNSSWANTKTDANGKYVLSDMLSGNFKISTWAGGPYISEYYDNITDWDLATPVELVSGQTTPNINISLATGGTIQGVVRRDWDAKSVSGLYVYAEGIDVTGSGSGQTSEDGSYAISGLTAGTYRIRAGSHGTCYAGEYYGNTYVADSAAPVTVGLGQTISGIDISLAMGGKIEGVVRRDSDGQPISGINVYVQETQLSVYADATTGPDGTYSICGLSSGNYIVRASTYGTDYVEEYYDNTDYNSATPVGVTVGQTTVNINFDLSLGGKIQGIITSDLDAAPVSSISVYVYDYTSGNYLGSATTEEDGSYTISKLPGGSYRIEVTTWGTNYEGEYYNDQPDWASASEVFVVLGQTTANINISLELKTGNILIPISTNVTGENTNVLGATVSLVETGQTATWVGDGNYTFYDVPAGNYTLKIEKEGFETQYVNAVVTEGNNNLSSIPLTFETCGQPGDIDGNGLIGLEEAINALQVVSGVKE
jgi:hypothetical protein